MRSAITQLEPDIRRLLEAKFTNLSDHASANDLLCSWSGIENFFETTAEFLRFKTLLSQEQIIWESHSRRAYGDYQTPLELADKVCAYLVKNKISPAYLLEPTFGQGAFFIAARKYFPELRVMTGLEIYEPYVWFTKVRLLQFALKNPEAPKPRIVLYQKNIFDFDFRSLVDLTDSTEGDLVVLGNPPWVTNTELGALGAQNLPKKRNLKSLSGLDALTGQSNFDIAEYIVWMLLEAFADRAGYFSMLIKNSVVKNLVHDLPAYPYDLSDLSALRIDAKKYFSASVEASLLTGQLGSSVEVTQSQVQCQAGDLDSPHRVSSRFGWVNQKFVSNIDLYTRSCRYDHQSPFVWRQGLKHDCARVMELTRKNGRFLNGLAEEVALESKLLYGLAKSADVTQPLLRRTKKVVIVTQTKVGEETRPRLKEVPQTEAYLRRHEAFFANRKSSIYNNKPPFSIFGIGPYSFKPYKVALSGLYKTPRFCLVLPQENKPVMVDDTCYFLGFDDISQAIYVWAALNQQCIQDLLRSITFKAAKRPYTKKVLMRIDLALLLNDLSYEAIHHYAHSVDKRLVRFIPEEDWLRRTTTNG